MKWQARGALLAGLIGLLCACAPERSVRVEPAPGIRNKPAANAARAPDEYIVANGDTLYGIAFRHKLDYRELAAHNNIAAPYTIYPGQRLRLGNAPVSPSASNSTSRSSAARSKPATKGGGVVSPIVQPAADPASTTPRVASTPPVAAGASGSPSSAATAGGTVAPVAGATTATVPPLPASKPVAKDPPVSNGPLRWRWPSDGQLISRFLSGDPTRQGINLAGSAGDPVLAAANGVVVYSGSGLIGYGELVIIKHDDTWLSAYGHNRKRLVAEGDAVQGGQQVAEMGRSGASRDMLHFEVRKNGRPIDPLSVLPKR